MFYFKNNYFVIVCSIFFICTMAAATRRMSQKQRISPQKATEPIQQKPIIIFDCINVLFKESQAGFAQKVGYGVLASYALTHWKNPGCRCLDMLHAISKQNDQQPHLVMTLQEKTMPRCIVELHEGKKTCQEVKNEIKNAIEQLEAAHFFSSAKEKNLMQTIMNLILDPTIIAYVTEPIKPMVSLAQKLKNNGYSLYMCANIPAEFYALLQNKYASILSLFDGIIISSQIKTAKPHESVFKQLLSTYNLDPKQCIVIDNAKENMTAAQSLGMQAIVYEKQSPLTSYLKKRGVVI